MFKQRSNSAIALIVIAVTAVAFFPSLLNGYVDWDDPGYVTENDVVRSISAENVRKAFSQAFVSCYCPLAILTYMAEYRFFDYSPLAYHATNYVLHLLITALVFYLIFLISGKAYTAFITALLFGIHPLHVESVAWISQRKDLLCALFYVLGLILYDGYLKKGGRARYALLIASVSFALLSKPMAVTMPVAFLLLDYYEGRKMSGKLVAEKIPFFVLAIVFGVVNMRFQTADGATGLVADAGVKTYFISKSIPFYISKMIAPVRLSAMYPYHNVTPEHLVKIPFYVAAMLFGTALVVWSRKFSKDVVFGSLFFLIAVLPVLKIIPAGDVFAADRYMYLPSIGAFFIAATFCERALSARSRIMKPLIIAVLVFAAGTYSITSFRRCGIWKNSETLFSDVIRKYPNIPLAQNNLGTFYAERGEYERSIRYFRKALSIEPTFSMAKENIEKALAELERLPAQAAAAAAIEHQVRAESRAKEVELLNIRGIAEGVTGDLDGAISLFRQAIALDPEFAESYNNLGFAYYQKGDHKEALKNFEKALEINPDHERAGVNADFLKKQGAP
ncbi:MAG: tetratricopeptide repeat protein [Candidatus Omnitrophota bacterium]